MGDLLYRLLGLVVQARFQIAAILAVANGVFLLLEVHLAMEAPSGTSTLGLLDSPLLLTAAVLLIAQLPPGVLFRANGPAAVPRDALARLDPSGVDPPPDEDQWGCRASANFRAGEASEWRLLIPSSIQLTRWGGVEISAPIYAVPRRSHAVAPLGVRTLDWSRPRIGLHPPVWGSNPAVAQRRAPRREPEPIVQSVARLAIPAPTLAAVTRGWQYAGLRRYPALRLEHHAGRERPQYTYLAFGSTAARDAVIARLA